MSIEVKISIKEDDGGLGVSVRAKHDGEITKEEAKFSLILSKVINASVLNIYKGHVVTKEQNGLFNTSEEQKEIIEKMLRGTLEQQDEKSKPTVH
ncbi:hypothetical protein EY403_08255 [Shigella sonnei]|nr:hypothetical protein [Escherichia coli]EFX1701589.1 hypothetical protein [Shigella sonnei]EEZ5551856.1 hypothetical protein [Escherichia coli]EFX1719052.1 hypothetical protein [Shigella sonnei]EFX2368274.1 hypothetical protein [Shigella sonnei]